VFQETIEQIHVEHAQARAVKLKELQAAQAAIKQVALYLPFDSIDLERGQEKVLARLVATVQTLFTTARFVRYDVQVDAIGRADRTRIAKKDAVLRQQRASVWLQSWQHEDS
jgi:hypothetical protein